MKSVCVVVLILVSFTACDKKNPILPRSGGKPFEVLLVGDKDSILYNVLNENVENFPQPESMFDVSVIDKEHFNMSVKHARSIVMADIDSNLYSKVSIRYDKNVYAEPQMIVYVNAPSIEKLRAYKHLDRLNDLLTRHEMNVEIGRLGKKHNLRAKQTLYEMFGMYMKIPADINSSKRGKDFIWMSDNASSGMRNICVYRIGHNVKHDYVTFRDSVMAANIKGETDDMYMKTVKNSCSFYTTDNKRNEEIIVRGLWEMHGDAMGGAFVSRIINKDDMAIVAECFVYAPEMKKRNILRKLEASLYTLKAGKDKHHNK